VSLFVVLRKIETGTPQLGYERPEVSMPAWEELGTIDTVEGSAGVAAAMGKFKQQVEADRAFKLAGGYFVLALVPAEKWREFSIVARTTYEVDEL
jgi:hypothetical protein